MRRQLLGALICCLAVTAQADSAEPLFAATLGDLADKPVDIARFKGRPLVVNFWARWCGPCRDEIPHFIAARAKYQSKGAELLGIAIEDNTEGVRDFAKAYDIDYPVLMAKDKGLGLMQALGNTRAGLPFTLVVDRRGHILQKKLGPMQKADIEAAFESVTR